jgi:hypothetical protein
MDATLDSSGMTAREILQAIEDGWEIGARSPLERERLARILGDQPQPRWTHTLIWTDRYTATVRGFTLRTSPDIQGDWYVDLRDLSDQPMGPSYTFGSLSAARDYIERSLLDRDRGLASRNA